MTATMDWSEEAQAIWSWAREHALLPAVAILAVLLGAWIFRHLLERFFKDRRQRYYVRKVINFASGILIALILVLAIVRDARSVSTILGFTTAGVAIALQDVIISLVGCFFWSAKEGSGSAIGYRLKRSKAMSSTSRCFA